MIKSSPRLANSKVNQYYLGFSPDILSFRKRSPKNLNYLTLEKVPIGVTPWHLLAPLRNLAQLGDFGDALVKQILARFLEWACLNGENSDNQFSQHFVIFSFFQKSWLLFCECRKQILHRSFIDRSSTKFEVLLRRRMLHRGVTNQFFIFIEKVN